MLRNLLLLTFMTIMIAPAFSQEAESVEAAEDDGLLESILSEEEESEDDSDLDEQVYEEDDDDFVPTEEIPADVPIPFPSNI